LVDKAPIVAMVGEENEVYNQIDVNIIEAIGLEFA